MTDISTFNPLAAKDPKKMERRNIARCVRNEVIDMPLALKEKSNVPANEYVPFWEIEYEALDVKWADGNPLKVTFGSRLVDKNGDVLDNTQRPFVNAKAFAGFGIVAFPNDPNYDESAVIGQVFELTSVEFPTGRPANIPTAVLGADFAIDPSKVRVITPKGEAGSAVAVPAVIGIAPSTIELTSEQGSAQLEALKNALANASEEDAIDVIREAGLGSNLTLNGKGVVGLAINGTLLAALAEVN